MDFVVEKVDSLITEYDTNCPFKLSKYLGIEIVYENLGNTLGYYSSHFRIKVIHINQNSSEKQKEFICAHELGHAICHPNSNTSFLKKHTLFSTDRIEVEANRFAINLLFSSNSDLCISIDEAAKQYGIPKQLLLSNMATKIF